MKNKVVLYFPVLEEGKEFHWPPISLLALATLLKPNGFECVIIDSRVEQNADQKLKHELKDALCLGITAFTGYSLKHALKAAKICRETYPDVPIFFGGPHATALPEQSKRSALIDEVIAGYGEFEFLEKLKRLQRGESINFVYDRSEMHHKYMAPEYPATAYDVLDMKKYINPSTNATIYLTSYGCPGKCTFCSTSTLRRWTPFSMEKIKKDIDNLFKIHPFKNIVFYDATFFVNLKSVFEIVECVNGHGADWYADGRTYEIAKLNSAMIGQLEKKRLKSITIGLETGSTSVVDIMQKGSGHVERMRKIINDFKDSPISIASGIIFGVPGETIDDLKDTLKVIKKLCSIKKNFHVSTTFFRPLPDTDLYKILERDYNYKFPQTLEEWAELGERTHYEYNEAMAIPWFDKAKEKEYLKIYNEFWNENSKLFEARGL